MKQENHFHWIVYAYEKTDEHGNPMNYIILDLLANSAEEATAKSAKLIPLKSHYTVVQVIEHRGNSCK